MKTGVFNDKCFVDDEEVSSEYFFKKMFGASLEGVNKYPNSSKQDILEPLSIKCRGFYYKLFIEPLKRLIMRLYI